ncbi:MAG: fibrillarin-like rRNA/tRNA 2'-O-methyltransferase [Candidatus Aenigmarchaeota archaeon]|nr:fibrillarin-like rRNA/tRNA 2'-O-methyltransferase [Candidatus Aenigmarchaeota archaeon]
MSMQFPGVWRLRGKLLTRNAVPGIRAYSEDLLQLEGKEYRVWDPTRSKLAAALVKGLRTFPFPLGAKVLYLGIANGNTASFLSDIIGPEGAVYGVEISERSMRDLAQLAQLRPHIIPVLANAKLPGRYAWVEPVDVIYQDVAADDQAEILLRNAARFLKKGGFALLAIKARSIDVTAPPEQVFRRELARVRALEIVEEIRLDPLEKDHLFVVLRKP